MIAVKIVLVVLKVGWQSFGQSPIPIDIAALVHRATYLDDNKFVDGDQISVAVKTKSNKQ